MQGWSCYVSVEWGFSDFCGYTKLSPDGDSPVRLELTFNQLNFIKSGISTDIVLSFSTLLQHEINNVETGLIGIETWPSVLIFDQEPPDEVNVNEVF